MISVKDIINEARLGVKDFGKKTYSDYELITHINKSLRMICNYLSQRNNDFTERSVLICDTPIAKHFIEEIAINSDKLSKKAVQKMSDNLVKLLLQSLK